MRRLIGFFQTYGFIFFIIFPWILFFGQVFYPRYSEYTDLTITHIPNAIYLINSILGDGTIPLWNQSVFSGYPFAENPLAGLWYIPGWFAYLFPQPLGFNLAIWLHLVWGGWGIYRYAQVKGYSRWTALLGMLSFCLAPKLFAHWAAGHVTLLYAVAWTPWLIVVNAKPDAKRFNGLYRSIQSGTILGVITLADPRWLPYAGLMWLGLEIRRLLTIQPIQLKRIAFRWFMSGLFCVGIAAALWVGLAQYTNLSTRVNMSTADLFAYSLPLSEIPGLWIPDFGGFAEWTIYPGAVIGLLAIYTIAVRETRKQNVFWLVIFLISLVFALGEKIPGLSVLIQLPALNLMRVPARSMFIGDIALILLALPGIDDLLSRKKLTGWDPLFYMSILLGLTFFTGLGMALMGGNVPENLLWAFIFICLSMVAIGLSERGKLGQSLRRGVLFVLIVCDLAGTNLQSIDFRPIKAELSANEAVIAFLKADPSVYRIYAPSRAVSQLQAAENGFELINGIDPLQISIYADFFGQATGIENQGYSVTLPQYFGNDLADDAKAVMMNIVQLADLNVKYIVTDYTVEQTGLKSVYQVGKIIIYENEQWHGYGKLILSDDEVVFEPGRLLKRTANQIQLEVNQPGLLVIPEIQFPGWQVEVNGQKAEIIPVDTVFRAVNLAADKSLVTFTYRPRLVWLGLGISTIFWLLLLGLLLLKLDRENVSKEIL
jgi:hypothetical protein